MELDLEARVQAVVLRLFNRALEFALADVAEWADRVLGDAVSS